MRSFRSFSLVLWRKVTPLAIFAMVFFVRFCCFCKCKRRQFLYPEPEVVVLGVFKHHTKLPNMNIQLPTHVKEAAFTTNCWDGVQLSRDGVRSNTVYASTRPGSGGWECGLAYSSVEEEEIPVVTAVELQFIPLSRGAFEVSLHRQAMYPLKRSLW